MQNTKIQDTELSNKEKCPKRGPLQPPREQHYQGLMEYKALNKMMVKESGQWVIEERLHHIDGQGSYISSFVCLYDPNYAALWLKYMRIN